MAKTAKILIAFVRILIGFIFFWAFLDKVVGLGFATKPNASWLSGASPTSGFLKFGTHGPLAPLYQQLAGSPVVDWLFMLGLLGIGVALLLGIGLRIAAVSGALMMLLIYSSLFPPQNNPFIDEHIVYILLLLLFPFADAGETFGLGSWWKSQALVRRYPWLR